MAPTLAYVSAYCATLWVGRCLISMVVEDWRTSPQGFLLEPRMLARLASNPHSENRRGCVCTNGLGSASFLLDKNPNRKRGSPHPLQTQPPMQDWRFTALSVSSAFLWNVFLPLPLPEPQSLSEPWDQQEVLQTLASYQITEGAPLCLHQHRIPHIFTITYLLRTCVFGDSYIFRGVISPHSKGLRERMGLRERNPNAGRMRQLEEPV